jgi:GDP-L-fucose synthase
MVGSAIVRKLQKEGYENLLLKTSKELDLRNQQAVNDFFEAEKPDYVFLAAAKVGGIVANNTYRADFLYENLMIQSNTIHAAYKTGVKKLMFLGSSCIYPKLAPQPLKEEYLLTGLLEPTNEPYAIAKIAGIKICDAYRAQYGCNFISVMPTNLYGPNDNYDLTTSHVLPALLRKFHEATTKQLNTSTTQPLNDSTPQQLNPQPSTLNPLPTANSQLPTVTIWGTGTPRREFLHVDDLADACFFLMQHYNEPGLVNIGVGEDISIKELALMIKDLTGFNGEIVFDASKPDGTPRKLMDVSKLNAMGWKAKVGLREGIERVYKEQFGK